MLQHEFSIQKLTALLGFITIYSNLNNLQMTIKALGIEDIWAERIFARTYQYGLLTGLLGNNQLIDAETLKFNCYINTFTDVTPYMTVQPFMK